uniref:Uncharacterized protein n=1 Tax=Salix viminalis TaxID=40686 RepID=A0A6N2L9U8_SALVM
MAVPRRCLTVPHCPTAHRSLLPSRLSHGHFFVPHRHRSLLPLHPSHGHSGAETNRRFWGRRFDRN